MDKQKKKESKFNWRILLVVLLSIIILAAICFAVYKHLTTAEEEIPMPPIDLAWDDDTIDYSKKVNQITYEKLSGEAYNFNKNSNTISFDAGVNIESFCISTNANGPTSEDEWQIANTTNSYKVSEAISESLGDSETQKVYVYYMANTVSSFGDDYNAAADIYVIKNAEDLVEFGAKVNSGDDYTGKTIYLLNNISLKDITYTPIGTSTAPFAGTFDGNGYIIDDLTISLSGQSYVGLFGYNLGTIKNIVLNSGSIACGGNSGGIAGFSTGTIENCINRTTITASGGNVGGIVGMGSGTFRYCQNEGDVTSPGTDVGGIIGTTSTGSYVSGTTAAIVYNCRNTGIIKNTTNSTVGGIIGALYGGGDIAYCTNTGAISTPKNNPAGIVAWTDGTGTKNITNCKNTGNITGGNRCAGILRKRY